MNLAITDGPGICGVNMEPVYPTAKKSSDRVEIY